MHLDMNLFRSLITVTLFVLFILVCVWVWSPQRRDDYAAAARLPFDESDSVGGEANIKPDIKSDDKRIDQ